MFPILNPADTEGPKLLLNGASKLEKDPETPKPAKIPTKASASRWEKWPKLPSKSTGT